jgi:hypothetical protein
MILNTRIFNQTVETAKAKSAGNPAMLRAIDRAVYEINRSRYWAYDAQAKVLKLMSTTSKKLYTVDDAHTCEAMANGHKFCKHLVARRLMQRYTEALGVAAVAVETQRVQNWSAKDGHQIVETKRASVIPASGDVRAQRRAFWERLAAMPFTDLAAHPPRLDNYLTVPAWKR